MNPNRWTFWLCSGLLVATTGCGTSVSDAHKTKLELAGQKFAAAGTPNDYLAVAGTYQSVLDDGLVNGAILYNQGNAFLQAQHYGHAIASYRKAQRLMPRHAPLHANLQHAFHEAGVTPLAQSPAWLTWLDTVSYGEKLRLAGILGAATFALAMLGRTLGKPGLSRTATVGLCLTLVAAAPAIYDWYRYDVVQHGAIVARQTQIRQGAGISYGPAWTENLPSGTEFRVLDDRGDWLQVELAGQRQGWLPKTDVAVY